VTTSITVAYGDGIGPEIMEAVLRILKEAKADINIETVEVGKRIYEMGYSSGIMPELWESLKRTKVLLKSPITTPQGGGYKSLNVTMRKALGLYANIRPCTAFHPFIQTYHPDMDLVIIRENEEDLYAGIEYRQTHNAYHSIKLITRTGCERIIRYAFEYAVKNNRKKVTCFSKDNIMKFSDGIFHKVFDEIAKEYPQIENNHYIIDIGTAKLANNPELFDVIVTSNLYGDIISDVAAEVSGSVGMAGSSNIGEEYAMFEAVHGSAPDIAGQNMANPSGLLQAALMMLVHIGQGGVAANIHNAWLAALEDGVHTGDIYDPKFSTEKVGTKEFADAIIKRLGKKPAKIKAVSYENARAANNSSSVKPIVIDKSEKRTLVGVDIFVCWEGDNIDQLANQLIQLADGELKLQNIACKGLKVWPNTDSKGNGDHWAARFVPDNQEKVTSNQEIAHLIAKLSANNIDFIKTENLYTYGDTLGFSLGQGE
jgi:isocitrate dehydrogenase